MENIPKDIQKALEDLKENECFLLEEVTTKKEYIVMLNSTFQKIKLENVSDEILQDINAWLDVDKEFGFIEGNPHLEKAREIFKSIKKGY